MAYNKESLTNTFVVAGVLCLVCSALVSTAAVVLKPIQSANVQLDRKNNILVVAGFTPEAIEAAGGIDELFEKRFDATIIDLKTGKEAVEECKTALDKAGKKISGDVVSAYDQVWAAKSKNEWLSDKLSVTENTIGVKYLEKYSMVYLLKSEDGKSIEKYVFPVRGYGLWSMMKGYLAVEPDLETIAGLTFYDQKETPGLGGEIMSKQFKDQWPGKKIYKDGVVAFKVSKGDQSQNEYGVDALTGATITSTGVSRMISFWMGDLGFEPYIKIQRSESDPDTSSNTGEKRG